MPRRGKCECCKRDMHYPRDGEYDEDGLGSANVFRDAAELGFSTAWFDAEKKECVACFDYCHRNGHNPEKDGCRVLLLLEESRRQMREAFEKEREREKE